MIVCATGSRLLMLLSFRPCAIWPLKFSMIQSFFLMQLYMSRRDRAAEALHGHLVRKKWRDAQLGKDRLLWGRVHYRGGQACPNCFVVVYEDGDYQSATGFSPYIGPHCDPVLRWFA
jgi:hypothetical protein